LVLAPSHAAFNLAHATSVLLELSLGVVIGLDNWLCSFLEIVKLTQLVRDVRQDLLHSQADWALRVRDDCYNRHWQSLLDLAQQVGEVLVSSTVEVAGKQDFT
jgi:hypothetical protein